ncbi:MAG: hypothetical protein IV100_25945 [Myxococcales bacterium]|nr:hypothetical protein [Myxococcales bacterium]
MPPRTIRPPPTRPWSAALGRLRAGDAPGPEDASSLAEALRDGDAPTVAELAELVGRRGSDVLRTSPRGAPPTAEALLVAAFDRLCAPKSDPGCRARLAIATALDRLDMMDPDPFLRASRLVQREPVWGGSEDTAIPVRIRAMLALARLGHAETPLLIGQHLADGTPAVRQAGAAAAQLHGEPALAAALALVLLGPEDDPQVLVALWSAQLALAAEWALERAGAALMGDDDVRRVAAAEALAESGRADALRVLLSAIEETVLASERRTLVRALGLHRSAEAFDALVDRVTTGPITDALAALEAFALRRVTSEERERLSQAVFGRSEPRIVAGFEALELR